VTLTLAIETSSATYGAAVCLGDDVLAERSARRDEPGFDDVGHLAAAALADAGRSFADLGRLAVDVGPGYLGSVRDGVAYVNGLAFALGLEIFCGDSLELLALEADPAAAGPVLCLRNAGGGTVYAGLFRPGRPAALRHGPLAATVAGLAAGLPELTVAGTFRPDVKALLPEAAVADAGVEFPSVRTLHRLLLARGGDAAPTQVVASPLTDASPIFGG
jgi:tRNA threonylcarbamoyl adenosine modification protein YeaZ